MAESVLYPPAGPDSYFRLEIHTEWIRETVYTSFCNAALPHALRGDRGVKLSKDLARLQQCRVEVFDPAALLQEERHKFFRQFENPPGGG